MTFRSHPDYYALVKEALPGADFVGEENWYRAPAPKYCLPGDQCGDAHLTGGSGFVQIGDWRIGDVDNGDHFAISLVYPGGSAAVFTSTGLAHKGSERTSLPGTPPPFYAQAYSLGARKIMAQPQGIRVGDGFIEFNKKWRLWLTPGSKYLAVVHRSGTVAGAWYENDATGGKFFAGTGAPVVCPAGFPHYEEHALTEVNHGDVCRKGTPSSGGDWWRWECPTHCNKVAGLAQPYCADKTSGAPCRKQATPQPTHSSPHSLSTCQVGNADFAVWFRYGISISVAATALGVGSTLSANLGLAFGCDGAGTAFMFPTIDIGLDLDVGIVTPGVDHTLSIDLFANYDGLGVHGNDNLFKAGTGHAHDVSSSVWGNKLGWGLGAGITVGSFGIGLSFTLPVLEIGTSSVLGLEFPSSANFKRPRLAGIGISGDASVIWGLLAGSPTVIGDAVADSVGKPDISLSLGIGYVGIIGGKEANWFKAFGQSQSDAPAKGASCNNLLNDVSPATVFDCGDNVFAALPKSILTEWPFK